MLTGNQFDTLLYGLIGGLSYLFGTIPDGPWKIGVGTLLAVCVAIKAKRSKDTTPSNPTTTGTIQGDS